MRLKFFILIFLLIGISVSAQVNGKVVNEKGQPVAFASVFIENTFKGTSTNDDGNFEIKYVEKDKDLNLVVQFFGYKTQRIPFHYKGNPINLNVVLAEEAVLLNDIVISVGGDAANQIVRKAIKNKENNSIKNASFKADFYSKGMIKILKLPEGSLVKIEGGAHTMKSADSTGVNSNILYLSETVSKIAYQKPDQMREHIVASLVSGNNNGYSFNTARQSNFDFYDNLIEFKGFSEVKMISPISDLAFSYYKFKLEGSFLDGSQQIHKIKLIPKRDKEPVFEGSIYIVEESGAL